MDARLLESVKSPLAGYEKEETKNIRGSTLLLAGRILAVAINLGTQVLLVRYLSKTGYGAFAYALAIVSLGSSVAALGLEKSVSRFITIYQEQGEPHKVLGTTVLMTGTILTVSLAIVLPVVFFQGWLDQRLIQDREAVGMLAVLIALVPVHALESLFLGLLSTFAKTRAIFFRKYLVGPGLQFSLVLLLTLLGGSASLIAGSYLAAGIIGIGITSATLLGILRQNGLLNWPSIRDIELPWRDVFGFTAPLLVSDLVFVLRSQFVVVLVEYFRSTSEVADYRAVFPIARFNLVVYQNFVILYLPLASRMFVRNNLDALNIFYQKTAIWISVISFPLFVVSSTLSRPLVTFLFGERYAESAILLTLLSIGFYFSAALGFNGQTLRIFGKVRYIFSTDLFTALVSIALSLLLIPRYGALGGVISFCGTLILQNILYQVGLLLSTGVGWFSRDHLKVYGIIGLSWLGLLLMPNISISLMVAVIVSLLVIRLNRRSLEIERTFPELLRIPLMRKLFGN